VTRAEAVVLMEKTGHKVRLEFDTGTAHVDDWQPMTVGEFVAYASGFQEGAFWGYEGNCL
jgi:hypothetical protein